MENFIFRAYNFDKEIWEYFSPDNILNVLDELCIHLEKGSSFFLYTGYQDKYGNPIFDGDYVLINNVTTSIIGFSKGSFIYISNGSAYPLNTASPDTCFEVIGDVFNLPKR